MSENIGSWLAIRAFLSPERIAYIDDHKTTEGLNFQELNARSNQIANAFLASGIKKGERVAILLMNSPEFIELFFALGKVGAVVVPLNWRLVADELEFILKDSGATNLVFGDEFTDVVENLHGRGDKTDLQSWFQVCESDTREPFAQDYVEFRSSGKPDEPSVEVDPHDMLYIMYTSGTTGLPKGVVHTHYTSMWGALTIAATTYYRAEDKFISPLPMFHVGALTPLTLNVYRGITSIVMRTFSPVSAWQLISDHQITTGLFVPAMLNFMLQVGDLSRYKFDQWRWCMTGASPVQLH